MHLVKINKWNFRTKRIRLILKPKDRGERREGEKRNGPTSVHISVPDQSGYRSGPWDLGPNQHSPGTSSTLLWLEPGAYIRKRDFSASSWKLPKREPLPLVLAGNSRRGLFGGKTEFIGSRRNLPKSLGMIGTGTGMIGYEVGIRGNIDMAVDDLVQ